MQDIARTKFRIKFRASYYSNVSVLHYSEVKQISEKHAFKEPKNHSEKKQTSKTHWKQGVLSVRGHFYYSNLPPRFPSLAFYATEDATEGNIII